MKVKMLQDQHYIGVNGGKYCALAGEVVDIDPLFAKYIKGKFDLNIKEEKPAPQEKPLDKMNKEELVAKAKEAGIELEDEQFEKLIKADIIALIKEVQG